MTSKTNIKRVIDIIPTIGITVFVMLYIYSTTRYPGGSQADVNHVGFDWLHNYWCNLMNAQAINGETNPARSFAITGMMSLCLGLMVFFIQFGKQLTQQPFWKITIPITGTLSMLFASLMFTSHHDLMTILSSVFGLFVVVGIIWEIYQSKHRLYKYTGLVCIILLGLNNYIYYSLHFIEFLPLVQKISFIVVLLWIIGLNQIMRHATT